MPVNFIQPSFAAGELAPALYARVDLDKFAQGAKLLRNFFVWPQGGVSNRPGTMFVGRCKDSSYPVHLIPFQFNLVQTYILEFGHQYMRVIMNGGYVLEPVITIASVTKANPGVVATSSPHGYANGDQVYIAGTGTVLDSTAGRQYLVINTTATTFSLTDLDGNAINTTGCGTFAAGATVARVFTLTTPYEGTDVSQIKWTQSNDVLTLCHPSYPPCDLSRTQHWVWTMTQISFAAKISPPTGLSVGNVSPSGSPTGTQFYYSYVVTAVSLAPPEQSLASVAAGVQATLLDSDTGAQNTISWTANTAADLYYVYKANPQSTVILGGAMYGYIGQTTGTSFVDIEIAPDFSRAPPTHMDPFNRGAIATVSVTNGGSGYLSNATLYASDVSGSGAVLSPTVTNGVITSVTVTNGGQNYQAPVIAVANSGTGARGHINVGLVTINLSGGTTEMVTATVDAMGQNYFGTVTVTTASGGTGLTFTPVITNGAITSITVSSNGLGGSGYTDGDSLIFTQAAGGGAIFTCSINPEGNYPSCACYFQQRKCFAGSLNSPQTVWMTQPADYYNMDITNPSQDSDAVTFTIASQQVNAIKALLPMNNLLIFTESGIWGLLTGYIGQPTPVTPTNTVLVQQSYIGASDLPALPINRDVLYVQTKGATVRDLEYNFWVNIYTGTDMSVLAHHLFFNHTLTRWAYAEYPWYQIWCVREDGVLLSFTYLKEQNVYAWAHHDSPGAVGGDKFLSVASIPEQQVPGITVDSVYVVTQRTIPGINGGRPVQYVERMDSRDMGTPGAADVTKAWFVDAGAQYSGSATANVAGLDHLNGATVSILADGNVMPQQVVANGAITLPTPASRITVGLPYVAQMQSLPMMPQGMAMQALDYRKTLKAIALKVQDTRGVKVGPSFSNLTELKEWNSTVTMGGPVPLTTGTQRLIVYQQYTVDDNLCLQCDQPLPCTILGISPEMSIGDSPG